MEGEAGFPGLPPFAFECIAVGSLRGPQWTHAQLTMLEDLGVAQRHCLPCLSPDSDAHPSNKILAEIHDGETGWGEGDGTRLEQLDAAYGRSTRGRERCQVPVEHLHTSPITVIGASA